MLAAVLDRRAWRRIAYLLLSLPLGTAYFAFLNTALSVGTGLAIVLSASRS